MRTRHALCPDGARLCLGRVEILEERDASAAISWPIATAFTSFPIPILPIDPVPKHPTNRLLPFVFHTLQRSWIVSSNIYLASSPLVQRMSLEVLHEAGDRELVTWEEKRSRIPDGLAWVLPSA